MVSPDESQLSRAARYAVPFGLLLIPVWMIRVNAVVPEPYLDEVFHVPQAQAYWAHKWTQWDPKLTTPPGLYLWSYALCAALLLLRGTPTKLTTEVLRMTNVATTGIFLPSRLQTLLDSIQKVTNERNLSSYVGHTALNICLFPPLFFFSGLYYTDILALLVVVEAYNWDLKRASGGILSTLGFLVFGLAALVCRQTNIFWVSVFLGGLQVVRKIRTSSSTCSSSKVSKIVKQGLQQNELYDPLVSEATLAGKLIRSSIHGVRTLIKATRLFQDCYLIRSCCCQTAFRCAYFDSSSSRCARCLRRIRDLEQWSCPR
jgi:alpha-1,2-glucosyltransferase